MKKNEIIQLHAIVRKVYDNSDKELPEDYTIQPSNIHRKKSEHKGSLFTLLRKFD